MQYLIGHVPDADKFVGQLAEFIHTEAKLPMGEKTYLPNEAITLSIGQSREEIIEYLGDIRGSNTTADLAFYAYRDMGSCSWEPFFQAALERNPVSIKAAGKMSIGQVYEWLEQMPNESIYEGKRLAQPDEVVNYGRGDGIEKAILLANIIRARGADQDIEIIIDDRDVVLKMSDQYRFVSGKGLTQTLTDRAAR